MCVGKGLASGLPLAGIVARADVMDWEPGGHGSTFGGNPVACAAAAATLDLVEGGLADNAAAVGARLLAALEDLAAEQPLITPGAGTGADDRHRPRPTTPPPRRCRRRRSAGACSRSRAASGPCASPRRSWSPATRPTPRWPSSPTRLAARRQRGRLAVMTLPSHDQLSAQGRRAARRARRRTARSASSAARTPITGGSLGPCGTTADVDKAVAVANEAFLTWRTTPAPVRGNLVRRLGELLRAHKDDLGALVSIEAGKIRSEGLGEVQEMIDICDFAVGLSRQLHGLTIASERPGHRLMETWHPIGPCAVITAFNFPVAVWSWNAALALVAGDPVLWKPSDKTPLTALACDALVPAGRGRRRRARRPQPGPPGRPRGRRGAGRPRRRGRRLGHRVDPDGPGGGARWSPRGSAASSSSWAATTRRSSPRAPTSTSPSGASPSRPSARPDSAAPACAA